MHSLCCPLVRFEETLRHKVCRERHKRRGPCSVSVNLIFSWHGMDQRETFKICTFPSHVRSILCLTSGRTNCHATLAEGDERRIESLRLKTTLTHSHSIPVMQQDSRCTGVTQPNLKSIACTFISFIWFAPKTISLRPARRARIKWRFT